LFSGEEKCLETADPHSGNLKFNKTLTSLSIPLYGLNNQNLIGQNGLSKAGYSASLGLDVQFPSDAQKRGRDGAREWLQRLGDLNS